MNWAMQSILSTWTNTSYLHQLRVSQMYCKYTCNILRGGGWCQELFYGWEMVGDEYCRWARSRKQDWDPAHAPGGSQVSKVAIRYQTHRYERPPE